MNSDSSFTIKYKYSSIVEYVCEAKINLVIFISNFGGLFALWFGLSFIDLSFIITNSIKIIKINILKIQIIIFLKSKLQFLILFSNIIKNLFIKLDEINWKFFLKILSVILLLCQLYDLLKTYLLYLTIVNFELTDKQYSNQSYKIHLQPAVSVCIDFTNGSVLFDENNMRDIEDQNTETDYDGNFGNFHYIEQWN